MQTDAEHTPKNEPPGEGQSPQGGGSGQSNASSPSASAPAQGQGGTDGAGGAKTDPTAVLRGVAGTTSRVVYQAASILEEEIAAGIVAARQVEDRLVGSKVLPVGERNTLMQRVRKDAHEVVDIVLDLVNVAAEYAGMPAQTDVSIRAVTQQEKTYRISNGQLPTLVMPTAARAGESVELAIDLENNLDEATGEFTFLSTDLVSAAGDRISARQVKFTPPLITMEAYKTEEVTVAVNVPRGKPVGRYSGLIRTTKADRLRVVIIVQVGQAE